MRRFINIMSVPLKGKGFIYLLLINLLSNWAYVQWTQDNKHILPIIFISFFAAYIENAIVLFFRNKVLSIVLFALLAIIHNIFIVIDYFLLENFGRIFNQSVVDIISETNNVEVANFIDTYLTLGVIERWIFLIVILNSILYVLSFLLSYIRFALVIWALGVIFGLGINIFMVYSYTRFHDGMGITQYNTIMRATHSFAILNKTQQRIIGLRKACEEIKVTQTFTDKPTVVLVIGESASVYHSTLYGYEKNTTPLILERIQKDGLVVFNDMVTVADYTLVAMESIFSLNKFGEKFSSTPLFPAVFRSAGYKTLLYDNQYFVGQGVTFMSDKKLSDGIYDYRNSRRYLYDGEMVENIKIEDTSSLYVIHLWGQHYVYAYRYPDVYEKFKADDYDAHNYSLEKRETIAHYDNATLYNDYVLNEIIKKFENQNCCLIYLSDHGEEVYEQGDFIGHGSSGYHADINYVIRVPFWIWMSQLYKENHPDIAKSVNDSKNQPGISDDVSHLLLDMAGIKTFFFSPERSIVNNSYDSSKPRIVLNSIVYSKK